MILATLRNKEVRGNINTLMSKRPDIRNGLFKTLAELYNLAQRPQDALRAYRQSLGLLPDSKTAEAEKSELIGALKMVPDAMATIKEMREIAESIDPKRVQLIEDAITSFVKGEK